MIATSPVPARSVDARFDALTSVLERHLPRPAAPQLRRIPIKLVQECVARQAGMTRDELLQRKRTADLAHARQVAVYLTYELCGVSLPQTAKAFYFQDHTTVMYARDRIKAKMAKDPAMQAHVDGLMKMIRDIYDELRATPLDNQTMRALLHDV